MVDPLMGEALETRLKPSVSLLVDEMQQQQSQ